MIATFAIHLKHLTKRRPKTKIVLYRKSYLRHIEIAVIQTFAFAAKIGT